MVTPPEIPGLSDWRPLARGGFATVWQARQESLNRLVAVKVDQRTLEVETEQRRFLREAGAAGRMSGHPGIVTVHDAGILTDDRPYLVMELCPGGSLTRWLKPESRPTQQRVREVGVRIADALAAAHSRGVLHRDVKPANILIDAYDHPGLADFGLAALPDPGMELSQTLEALTPAYAPPEAFEQQSPTEFGDVYSLAATLYALLKGQPPRQLDGDKPGISEALDQLKKPIERIPGVDPGLMDLLMTAMADHPIDRPTAAEFRDRLAALPLAEAGSGVAASGAPGSSDLGGGGPSAGAGEVGERAGGIRRRRRSWIGVVTGAVLLFVAVVVAAAVLRPESTTAGSAPSGTVSAIGGPTSPSPNPASPSAATPVAVPRGFSDCSTELGADTYCPGPGTSECWGAGFSYMDSPYLGTRVDCYKPHIYQTFAAGQLPLDPRHQSQVDKDPRVKRVCTEKVLNSMLDNKDRRPDWEILRLPPQTDSDGRLYRCVFGHGERDKPFALHRPS